MKNTLIKNGTAGEVLPLSWTLYGDPAVNGTYDSSYTDGYMIKAKI
jgi:hypothetical protein